MSRSPIQILLFVLCVITNGQSFAAYQSDIQKFSTMHVTTDKDSLQAEDSMWVMFHLELKPGWYTYWENPGDSGLPPSLQAELPKAYSISKLIFSPPTIIRVADLVDYGYYDNAYFLAQITVPKNASNHTGMLKLKLDWVVCKDICIPQQGEVSFNLPIGKSMNSNDLIDIQHQLNQNQAIESVPATLKYVEDKMLIEIPKPLVPIEEPFLTIAPKGAATKAHQQNWQLTDDKLSFSLASGSNPLENVHGFIQINPSTIVKYATPLKTVSPQNKIGLGLSIAFAFLGGILLNLMPCVFPILALKIASVAKLKVAEYNARLKQGFAYTSGILVAFTMLAATISLFNLLGHQLGWGFQMQSPIFIGIMTYVLFIVALNLFGWFEFIVPISIDVKPGQSHIKQSFYTGLLITVVATPCTAPFMAPAIGFAVTQNTLVIFTIFISLGLGLAVPYLLFAFVPPLTKCLPKPGPWLMTFKQCLAFPMLLSTLWLLWLLMRLTGPNFVALILVGLSLISFCVWLNFKQLLSKTVRSVIYLMVAAALIVPFMAIDTKPKTPAPFTLSHFDSLIEDNPYAFVNVTADWCLTCKVNETILKSKEVVRYLEQHNIQAITIDWTKPNPEINQYLERFDRNGVPLYVFYVNGKPQKVLPQWLTPGMITTLIEES